MQTLDVINEIKKVAETNHKRPEAHKIKEVIDLKVGECYRQGDIYVFKVSDTHPVGNELKRNQIADGFSLGARHCLVGEFKIYEGVKYPVKVSDIHKRAKCLGYAFDVLKPGVLNTHPEHDDFKFCQTGRFQVIHQVDMMTLKRVAD